MVKNFLKLTNRVFINYKLLLLIMQQFVTGWWRRFLKRQDDKFVLRKGDSTAFVRMDAINEETLTSYYKLLEDTLQENKLQNCPSQIYNVDETGVPLNPKPPKIVVPKGMKKP